MAAEAATAAEAARPAGPTPAAPPPDPRLVAAAGRLGKFYSTLVKRRSRPAELDLFPGERRGDRYVAQVGVGPHQGRTVDYAAALVIAYGPHVVDAWEVSGAETVIQGWIIGQKNSAKWAWDPSTSQGPPEYHPVDTTEFRADFDAVIAAVNASGPGVVSSLLGELAGVIAATRREITPQWAAGIHVRAEAIRAKLLETVPSGKHMRGDPYDDVPRYRGAAARMEFGPTVLTIGDPLLSTLFEQPDGVEVLRALAGDPGRGAARADAVVGAAATALREFREELKDDVHWRYPEFRPAVLERLGLAKIPGLAEYLTAIGDRFVKKSIFERSMEAAGLALMALSLIFTGGASAVVVSAAGVVVAGIGLGIAFLDDQEHARAAQAYAFKQREQRLIEPRFPVGTAIAAAALLLSAIGFYFTVKGLRAPTAPRVAGPRGPARPGVPPAAAPPAAPPPSASATAPAAKATDRASRLTGKANQGTGAKLAGEAPKPTAPSTPAAAPPAGSAPGTATTPPPLPPRLPPREPTPPASSTRPASQPGPPPPRDAPEPPRPPRTPDEPASGKPAPRERGVDPVRPAERRIPPDDEELHRDAVRAIERRLARFESNYTAAQQRILDVLEQLDKVPENAELIRRLEIAAAALEDPASYGDLVVALRREVDAIRNAGVPPAAWEEALGLTTDELRGAARLVGLNEQTRGEFAVILNDLKGEEFFKVATSSPSGMVDLAYAKDDHSILGHALQDWMITRRLAAQNAGTAGELRTLLAGAHAPAGWTSKDGLTIGSHVWAEMWDSTGDMIGQSGMHSPEFLTRMLKPDFPGIAPFNPSPPATPRPIRGR